MRTTLSIDDDVAHLLNQEMRRSGASLKKTINDSLRRGLTAGKQRSRRRFVVTARPLGLPEGQSYDNVQELLDQLEGAGRK